MMGQWQNLRASFASSGLGFIERAVVDYQHRCSGNRGLHLANHRADRALFVEGRNDHQKLHSEATCLDVIR